MSQLQLNPLPIALLYKSKTISSNTNTSEVKRSYKYKSFIEPQVLSSSRKIYLLQISITSGIVNISTRTHSGANQVIILLLYQPSASPRKKKVRAGILDHTPKPHPFQEPKSFMQYNTTTMWKLIHYLKFISQFFYLSSCSPQNQILRGRPPIGIYRQLIQSAIAHLASN